MRAWVREAINSIEADFNRSADTHLLKLNLAAFPDIDLYLKDESTHPSGSLKHRLARSLFLYALCNGKINQGSTIVEASSGSTAVSEAYFARLLNLPFIAVMPESTAASKVKLIEFYGGQCHFVNCPTQMHDAAMALAEQHNGYFMDQFAFAERATDWRGNNNIAESIFQQMQREPHPIPDSIVVGAGTGGTSATIGRYLRYRGYNSKLVVVDPENSAFYPSFTNKDPSVTTATASRIEGIGRPQVEASFQPDVIDQMLSVPDPASVAAMLWLQQQTGLCAGPSTGTNLWGMLQLATKMREQGQRGSIVSLLCDSGTRYQNTYYQSDWVAKAIGDIRPYQTQLQQL